MDGLIAKIDRFLDVGSGSGDGDGSGDGSGYGYGSGDGSGYGSGYGYGDGYGSGSGDGDGSGDGSGDGISAFAGNPVVKIDGMLTIVHHIRGGVLSGALLMDDLTTRVCWVVKSGDLFAHGATLKAAQAALLYKMFDGLPEEERIDAFVAAYPSADQTVKNTELFDWHHRLTGSCEQGRRAFAQNHGIDLIASMTVSEFIRLTSGDYGGATIKKLAERYSPMFGRW